jgi:quinol monooxygenase YgiN
MELERAPRKDARANRISEDLEKANDFVIVERWTSLEAQYSHFRRPEFGQLMGDLGNVLAGPPRSRSTRWPRP